MMHGSIARYDYFHDSVGSRTNSPYELVEASHYYLLKLCAAMFHGIGNTAHYIFTKDDLRIYHALSAALLPRRQIYQVRGYFCRAKINGNAQRTVVRRRYINQLPGANPDSRSSFAFLKDYR
jgi:hypothetical protein